METTQTPLPDVIGTGEAARLLNVHPATVRRMIESGELRAVRIGHGHNKIARDSVAAILAPLAGGDR